MKKEPRYLSEEEYSRLLRACSHHARDAAIVEVFLQTGMRLSELAGLTLPDIELPKRITRDIELMGSVCVHRKGGKVGRIPLNYKGWLRQSMTYLAKNRANPQGRPGSMA